MIQTERLTIRRFRSEDWSSIRAVWSAIAQTDAARYDRPKDLAEDAMRSRIARWADLSESTEHMFFAVLLGDTLIGHVSLNQREDGYEIGYGFHPAYHGKGYAFESLSAILSAAAGMGIRRIEAGTALANLTSVRLLARLGFRQTGTEQVSFYRDEDGHDIFFEGGIFELDLAPSR